MDLEFKDIDLFFRVTYGVPYEKPFLEFDFESYEDAHNLCLLLRKADESSEIRLSVESADFEF